MDADKHPVISFSSTTVTKNGSAYDAKGNVTMKGNKKLALAPQVGWANGKWDFGIHFDNYLGQSDPYGFVALRVAYGF